MTLRLPSPALTDVERVRRQALNEDELKRFINLVGWLIYEAKMSDRAIEEVGKFMDTLPSRTDHNPLAVWTDMVGAFKACAPQILARFRGQLGLERYKAHDE